MFDVSHCLFGRHPLFPLLALLLEKCEEATRGEVDTRVVLGSLENDVRAFIQHEAEGNKKLMTDNPEVDGLVSHLAQPPQRYTMTFLTCLDAEGTPSVENTLVGA